MEQERIDEALELLWVLDEEGHHDLKRFNLSSDDADIDAVVEVLSIEGLADLSDGEIKLTDKGTSIAKGLIRRHRLADTMEEDACKVEHILSEELTDSVCTFLGHPPVCPHGKPIPRGECCKKYSVDVRPVVTRLIDFEVGKSGKIVFITPSEAARIGRLSSIGIIPGTIIKLIQRKPSIVMQMDETTIAIDPELAKEIFVKKIS